jgi:hypothetical protein
MKEQIPEGIVIGEIEASLAWLLSHVPNFQGAIVIRISTGKGFILFEYGRPVGFSFRIGDRVLEGAAARRFFSQQEVLKASLRRYTEKEFVEALSVAWPNALIPGSRQAGWKNAVSSTDPAVVGSFPAGKNPWEGSVTAESDPDLFEDEPITGKPVAKVPVSGPAGILDRIICAPDVTAALFLKDGLIMASRGDVIPGHWVESTEEILLPAGEAMALVSDGPLVQITFELDDGNITYAPFDDGYLLFMTKSGIDPEQIRGLLREAVEIGKG